MIKLEHVVLASPEQMEFIIEGMRNSKNSWEKSDSVICRNLNDCHKCLYNKGYCVKKNSQLFNNYYIGTNDLGLMQRLSNAGTEHRKYMQMTPVYVRITAPLYWWKEFDTYKVGTVSNSCSTMHTIAEKEFTLEDFSTEHLTFDDNRPVYSEPEKVRIDGNGHICLTINLLNYWRKQYLKSKSKNDWWQLIQLLPSSYNQTRNIMLNYEVLANIYRQRKNHKLDEWREFCKWIELLPCSEIITGFKEYNTAEYGQEHPEWAEKIIEKFSKEN